MNKQKDFDEIRPPFLMKFVVSIVLATLFFALGFLLTYLVLDNKYSQINEDQMSMRYDLLKFEVEEKLLEGSCESFNPLFFTEEMDNMGTALQVMEKRKGKDDKLTAEQKDRYFLLETKHLLYILNHNKNCRDELDTILFFYSTNTEGQSEAERIGSILEVLKKDNKNVMVYSFDYDLNSTLVNILKTKYSISSGNVIVINERSEIKDIKDLATLKQKLA